MKYTLKQINSRRFDPNRSLSRKLSERYIPLNLIGKILSPYPTYLFLNLSIHPDWITFMSLIFILIGSGLIITGHAISGVYIYLMFILFDSVDGDMARTKGPTCYGAILDSFGADLFYACAPVSFGYYLSSINVVAGSLSSQLFFLIGAFASITFLAYRLVNFKMLNFSNNSSRKQGYGEVINEKVRQGLAKRVVSLYRHILVKGNFFSEPGMAFWFFILTILGATKALGVYLLIILIYNIGYLIINFLSAYIYFISCEKNEKKYG